ncbi:MAG: hypothetical protein K6G50_01500 [bacterium]|nr:hypothetical protein [bacterium]
MKRVLLFLIASLALAFMVIYAVHAIFCLAYPHQLEYGEGLCMALTRRIIDAGALYNDPSEKPWLLCEYTPLFFLLCSVLSGGNLSFFIGRLVSVISYGIAAGIIVWRCGKHSRKNSAKKSISKIFLWGAGGWTAALLILSDSVQAFWSVLFRVDFLGIALTMAGLVFAEKVCQRAKIGKRARFIHVVLAGFFLTLAFFTKQSFVSALAASAIALLLVNKKAAWEYISVCGILLGTGLLMLQMFFGDKFLYVMLNCTGMYWTWARFSEYALSYWVWKLPLLVLSALALRYLWPKEKLWCLYAVISFLTVPFVGRAGSYYNYFLEPYLALSILIGLYAGSLWKNGNRTGGYKRGGILPVWVLAIAFLQSIIGAFAGFNGGASSWISLCRDEIQPLIAGNYPIDRACEKQLMDTVIKEAGEIAVPGLSVKEARETEFVKIPVLAEDMGCFVAEGYEVWLVDPATYCDMEHIGIYDFSELNKLISEKFFSFIEINDITRTGRFPESTVKAIKSHYCSASGEAGERLFVPVQSVSSEK